MKKEPGKVYIKSQDDDFAVIAGYGVVFGGEDLDGEHFDKDTDFMPDLVPVKPLFYEHTMDVPQHPLGKTIKEISDEAGIWIEAQIDKSRAYAEAVLELIGEGVIGLSSGTAGHLTDYVGSYIRRWPIVEYSLTPQPAEPRTLGVSEIKSLFDAAGLEMPETFNEAERQKVAEELGREAERAQVKARIFLLEE
jgi:phage head maturation protease